MSSAEISKMCITVVFPKGLHMFDGKIKQCRKLLYGMRKHSTFRITLLVVPIYLMIKLDEKFQVMINKKF